MTFLDEKIAKIQKQELIKKNKSLIAPDEICDNDIQELSVEEIITAVKNGHLSYNDLNLDFEIQKCFDDAISFPLPKEFFYKAKKSLNKYEWYNAEKFSIILGKTTLNNENSKLIDINNFFEMISRKTKLFIENTDIKEEECDNYIKHTIESRMASVAGFIYICSTVINIDNQDFYFVCICLEKNKNKWKSIIAALSSLIEVCEGDK